MVSFQIKNNTIERMRTLCKQNLNKIKTIELNVTSLKLELIKIRKKQLTHYYSLLIEGTDHRQEGLLWIVRVIWYIGFEVDLKHFPRFLDNQCIEYILRMGKITLHHMKLQEEFRQIINSKKFMDRKLTIKKSEEILGTISKIIGKPNKTRRKFLSTLNVIDKVKVPRIILNNDIITRKYKKNFEMKFDLKEDILKCKLTSELTKIRNQIKDEKRLMGYRIIREFENNDYEKQYGINIEKLSNALFGYNGLHIEEFSNKKKISVIELPYPIISNYNM